MSVSDRFVPLAELCLPRLSSWRSYWPCDTPYSWWGAPALASLRCSSPCTRPIRSWNAALSGLTSTPKQSQMMNSSASSIQLPESGRMVRAGHPWDKIPAMLSPSGRLESTPKGELQRKELWPDQFGGREGSEKNQREADPSFGLEGNLSPWEILSAWRPFQLLLEKGHWKRRKQGRHSQTVVLWLCSWSQSPYIPWQ